MDISRCINDLLFEHDCVIIPNFGGFVCSYQAAIIHPVQNTFQPPSKSLLFNPQLKTNDGLLANQIVVSHKITYEQALQLIDEFVEESLVILNNGGNVSLQDTGVFYTDQEGNIQFKQDTKINFLKDSFGLSAFTSPKIDRNYRKSTPAPKPQFKNRNGRTANKKRVIPASLAFFIIPVLLIFGYFYFNTDVFNSNFQSKTSLVPDLIHENIATNQSSSQISATEVHENKMINHETSPVSQNPSPSEIKNDGATSEINSDTPDVVANSIETTARTEPAKARENLRQPVTSSGKKYHLIGGSFEKSDNADKFISEYYTKGYQPQIIGQAPNGYFRVSIMAYLRKEEALDELNKVRHEIPGAWVLRQ